MKTFCTYLSVAILIGLITVSCNSSESSGCGEVETDQKQTELSEAQMTTLDAQIIYESTPTQENCDAYTEAWDVYIVKLRAWIDCLEGPAKTSWEVVYSLQIQERNAFSC